MALVDFNNEQKIIQNEIRKFTQAEVEPIAGDVDKQGAFPTDVLKKLTDLGFMGAIIPDTYDGAGLDTTSLCIIVEEIARASASVAMVLSVHNCCVAYPLIKLGSTDQKNRFLKKLAVDTIGGCAMISKLDTVNRFTTTVRNSSVVLSGISDFVMNGAQAGIISTPVMVDNSMGMGFVEGTDGMIQETHNMLGLRSAGIVRMKTSEKILRNTDCILDSDGNHNPYASIMAYSNISFAAISLGIAESCFQAALAYSKDRKQFNRAICEFPMVREMLVDMRTRIDAARLLVYEAARLCDDNAAFGIAANNARLFSDETAVYAGTTSVQVHGGYGYTKDYPVERFFRDAKSIQVIGMHTYEIKEQIAKEILS